MEELRKVDHSAMTVNQILIIAAGILAFIVDMPWLAAAVALVMAVGTALGKPGFYPVYRWLLKPLGIVAPRILLDNPEPHRFAQGFGAVVLATGSVLLFSGFTLAGWTLVWMVAVLAALNAFVGFCVGCFIYYWLGRLRLPGFSKSAPAGSFPGMRPKSGSLADPASS